MKAFSGRTAQAFYTAQYRGKYQIISCIWSQTARRAAVRREDRKGDSDQSGHTERGKGEKVTKYMFAMSISSHTTLGDTNFRLGIHHRGSESMLHSEEKIEAAFLILAWIHVWRLLI